MVGLFLLIDIIRVVYGFGVVCELIVILVLDDNLVGFIFKMEGLIFSVNYSLKWLIMVLFINGMCNF